MIEFQHDWHDDLFGDPREHAERAERARLAAITQLQAEGIPVPDDEEHPHMWAAGYRHAQRREQAALDAIMGADHAG